MKQKTKCAVFSALSIALVALALWQLSRANFVLTIVFGAAGIIAAVFYFRYSIPDFLSTLRKLKEQKEQDRKKEGGNDA